MMGALAVGGSGSTITANYGGLDVAHCFDMSVELRELLIIQAESPPSLHEHLCKRPHLRDVQPAVVRGVGGSGPADRQCARHLTDDQAWCACPLRRLVCAHVAIVLVQAICPDPGTFGSARTPTGTRPRPRCG